MSNNILYLNKKFQHIKRPPNGFGIAVFESQPVDLENLFQLKISLESTYKFWEMESLLKETCLVSAYYKSTIAKSNRINELFKYLPIHANDVVVGARFGGIEKTYHIITYCISKSHLRFIIDKMNQLINDFKMFFDSSVTKEQLEVFLKDNNDLNHNLYSKREFVRLIAECSYIQYFNIFICEEEAVSENTIVTLFDTKMDIVSLLASMGISITNDRINQNTLLLFPSEYARLRDNAPFLISMAVSDFNLVTLPSNSTFDDAIERKIPEPCNEPIIGVIDTLFDTRVYFSKWVDYREMMDLDFEERSNPKNYEHGTAVTSLIVDLKNINPDLDDGCGRFRVRHFGVSLHQGGITSFRLMKKIETIIATNPDIHVWNLSLGSARAINKNFISPEASILDELQVKYPDIIFVVAGTNSVPGIDAKIIGSPADSINSLVVNSVKRDMSIVSYARRGPALSFFIKPDISYFGGDFDEPLNVCYPYSIGQGWGTSYAAPLISRKLAYLMDVLKIPRECAKALIIDSAVGWNREFDLDNSNYIGRGIVPINIQDIIQSKDDEIRFYIEGVSENYFTYEYDLPVPLNSDRRYPYLARATLCYFSKCSRNQGVDYTDTELGFKFGRTKEGAPGNIVSIDRDEQDKLSVFTREKTARDLFRKWDNVKILAEVLTERKRPKIRYERDNWGIGVTYSRRYDSKNKIPVKVKWGIVITLKAIDNKNRIEEFIQSCIINEWRVYEVSVENMTKVYQQSQLEIKFD
ncbi:S8 family peptidase [bacterium]|nr:S8 family peptidase [bacterium]